MTKSFALVAGLAFCLVAGVATERDAKACGGCFVPPGPSTQVTAHRMAFAVSAKRTVLWDQITYVGDPTDFGWVLPIRGKVDVGVSSDQLFDRLENSTAPQVTSPPPPSCPPPERRCRKDCFDRAGGFADSGTASPASDTSSVDVWSTDVVGPYEATQLSATDGTALRNWLTDHAYVLPASIGPVIDKYIAEGFGFLVIKLVPQKSSADRMVPIRIGFDGSSPSLPLRMIAAGTGAKVGIKLFVMGDGRWEAKNFANEEIKTADLVWDWQAMGSNLGPLEISLIEKHAGKVFVTETSEDVLKSTLLSGLPAGTVTTEAGTTFSTITDATELETAFPAKSAMRITRMFAELPSTALATDLDLQASLGGVVPRTRQATKSVNFRCQEFIEVDCPGISPDCSSGGFDAGGVDPLNPPSEGAGAAPSSGGQFGCASSSSPATMTWALGTIAGLALFSALRRKNSR
jgi:hypothetical protein